MKFLLVSAFSPNGKESGANRLRKLRYGLEANGSECHWLAPTDGFIAHGALSKIFSSGQILLASYRWIKANSQGFVIVSLPPPWLMPIAFVLACFIPRRLVVDYRDPILNQKINSRSSLYRFVLGSLEAAVNRRVRLIILAAKGIENFIASGIRAPVTILAGLDERELADTQASEKVRDKFKVIYGGTFYGSRSPLTLFQAIAKEPGKLKFEFYVSFNGEAEREAALEKISDLNLQDKVKISPQVSRPEFLGILREAGAGLVITHAEGSDYAIPGKIFDYITAGVLPWVVSKDPGLLEFLQQNSVRSTITSGWSVSELCLGLQALEEALKIDTSSTVHSSRISVCAQAKSLIDALVNSA